MSDASRYGVQSMVDPLRRVLIRRPVTQGDFAAAARANQISIYHLPTQSLVTKLTDQTLLKSGLYKQRGFAHRDVVQSLAFSPDGSRLATGSFREVKLWKRENKTAAAPVPNETPEAP